MTTDTKQHPILFSTPMVEAILKGSKTMTRRTKGLEVINSEHYGKLVGDWALSEDLGCENGISKWNIQTAVDDYSYAEFKCPYGQAGDILWVRESWNKYGNTYCFKAMQDEAGMNNKWKPSIHMPKEACRLFLQITDVRVERLQDISEEDAIAEGISCITKDNGRTYKYGIPDSDGLPGNDNTGWHWQDWTLTAINAFKSIWQSINGEVSWNANPFVWCISFERIEKPL